MSLSVEIIDCILGFLRDDPITLDECSGVFPEELVDRYLYANITIPGNTEYRQGIPTVFLRFNPKNFNVHLMNHPQVASYVRNLRILIKGRSAIHRKVPSILSQLSRVESTGLSGRNALRWFDFAKHFRTVFTDHLKLPTIRMISIAGIEGFPLSAFDECKNLRKLSLIGKFSEDDSPSTSSPYPLQHLEVTPQTSPRRFLSWAKTNTLHTLSFNFQNLQYHDTPLFPDILQGFSSTLVNLELDFGQFFSARSPITPFTLRSLEFPLLQCLLVHTYLIFRYELDHSQETWHSALPALITLLGSMANSTNMYRLSLHIQFFSTSPRTVTIDWPHSIVTLAAIPNICHPIKLYINYGRRALAANILSAIEQDPELKQLTKEAKLQIENGPISTLMQQHLYGQNADGRL